MNSPAPAPAPAVDDGRRRRAERSRDAVVDALLELYGEGELRPGVARIAERAGVSQSSVFRHFQDLDGLVAAAADRQWERIRERFEPPPSEGDVGDRVRALVDQRLDLHDAAGPAMRAGRAALPDSTSLEGVFSMRRALLRRQVESQFRSELDAAPAVDRTALLDALDAATSLEQVEYLRHDLGFGRARAARALERTLVALVGGT